MIQPIKHFAVNWVDGMKISKDHLVQQEDFVIDSIRDSNSLTVNSYNFGLLPINDRFGDKTIFELQNTATNDAQLIIKKCTAITLAGYRIELFDHKVNIRNLAKNMTQDQEEMDGDFYILASVNPFDHVSFGDIDADEIPPRHPFTKPNYRIELVDVSILNSSYSGGNYLVLGKVSMRSGMAQIDANFIPPCNTIDSHPKLIEYYGSFSNSLGNLRQYAFKIIQKTAHKNQNIALADNVKTLCKTIIKHLGENYFMFKNVVTEQPPIFLINIFSKLALQLYNDTQMMIQAELEEMLNYSLEWSEITPHSILNQLTTTAEITYDHHNTGEYFFNINQMMKSLELIFGKLSELDYIGQRKENIIVNEQEIISNNDPKKGWSVID
ncbi:hypothetical protein ASG01_00465 [Chryseobacterium sp. Leaf180]|uniref:hypothetical protein n=1 Tax=Chryseobacterium sp. Leaf180 TaxID=1736289 RepID=UPI0006FCC255|nr:hypothetical protein [Chryseobacterium sp. Leaf180]KQR94396.1 hypothetical protein ASG01_00465 [Chryseobacterium sp. Leaf180]